MNKSALEKVRAGLDALYEKYHHPEWIGTDPLKFVYRFESNADREIVGLIAASLAYGNVTYINTSISRVLKRLENSPSEFLNAASPERIRKVSEGFRHRWTSAEDLADLLCGIKAVVRDFGSLGELFMTEDEPDAHISSTLSQWVGRLKSGRSCRLLADPGRNSACKRLHLYLRWMVRDDCIDPGCWNDISSARLMIPLDTHMYAFALSNGFTARKSADYKTVCEITEGFRKVDPTDPARFDFSLTRPGITGAENIG